MFKYLSYKHGRIIFISESKQHQGGKSVHILVTSLNYKLAAVDIREKFTFQKEELNLAINTLKNTKSILECVIVSTCNRTEIYAVVDQLHTSRYYVKTFLANWFETKPEKFADYLTYYEDHFAVDHLFRVACGLDSMIVGETQILGQVRDSFFLASNLEATGTIFNQLFKQAITIGKRAHSETTIAESAVSVSYAAVKLATEVLGDLKNKNVAIVGAGKMSELTVKHLTTLGVGRVTVLNRTLEKAVHLAESFQGEAKELSELNTVLEEVDIVITSTSSKDYVIKRVDLERIRERLFLVDIAVPRNIDPTVSEIEGCHLFDIDDLQNVVASNLAERRREAIKITALIDQEVSAFQSWLTTLGVVPIITALRQKAVSVQEVTMESIQRKLPHLSERETKLIRKHMKSIVNQLLRDPIVAVKEMATEPNAEEALHLFTKIFAIDDPTEKQETNIVNIENVEFKQEVASR